MKGVISQFQRGIKKLNISIYGNPNLKAENKIIIPDIKYLKNQIWIINNAIHEISDQGYMTKITAYPKN